MTLRSLLPSGGMRRHAAYYDSVLGTSLELQCLLGRWWGRSLGPRAEQAVLEEILRQERIFSTFDPTSEISVWQETVGRDVPVSDELAEVLEASSSWTQRTHGAFDPTAEGWTRLWQSRGESGAPTSPADDERASNTGGERSVGGTPTSTPPWNVRRTLAGEFHARKLTSAPISLDAIAKGYIVDRACAIVEEVTRSSSVLINIGGDLRHLGDEPLRVQVRRPRGRAEIGPIVEEIVIRNEGVATSGGVHRGVMVDGTWHSHLIDPRTGRPVDHLELVAVVAPDAMTADVLATAFSVLGARQSLAIADSIPGVGCLLLRRDGARLTSAVWDDRAARAGRAVPVSRRRAVAGAVGMGLGLASAARGRSSVLPNGSEKRARAPGARVPWDDRFEAAITFSFGDPRGGMASRRPYVVVYIDDAEGNPVRTVSLWAQDASWIRNLRRWYRAERARQAAGGDSLVSTVTTPTRNPGRYTVVWDGRDDTGAPVEQGEYFVCLETIRQGGTNYFTRQAFAFESTPFTGSMEDYGAFRDIEVDFREKS